MKYSDFGRKRRSARRLLAIGALILSSAVGTWWFFHSRSTAPAGAKTNGNSVSLASMTDPPALKKVGDEKKAPVVDEAHQRVPQPAADPAAEESRSGNTSIDAARRKYESGQAIEARHELNAMLSREIPSADAAEVRNLLTRIADDTIFGRRLYPADPLIENYVIQSGDALARIAPKYKVSPEIIMSINQVSRPTAIRVDEKLKIPRGPFHLRIYKSDFRMDVYLQDLYVRSYRVGLGREGGTPEGKWRVKNRLRNPTYFPPPSAEDKRVVAADDPANPLGEFWIGLEGIEGQALGQNSYGIHGTIEPDSIGKAASHGCVRMLNEDVETVWGMVRERESTVTILP